MNDNLFINFQRWEKEGKIITVNGEKIVVAPEDLRNKYGRRYFTREDVRERVAGLVAGWRLPTVEEMTEIFKGDFELEKTAQYWVNNARQIADVKNEKVLPESEWTNVALCMARCVCDLNCLLE